MYTGSWKRVGVLFVWVVTSCFGHMLDITLDVYMPQDCDDTSTRYSTTAVDTLNFIANSDYYANISITSTTFDTCDESAVLDTLVTRLGDSSLTNHVTVGPGVHSLCEPIVRLANRHNKTVISYTCTQKELGSFPPLQYHLRSVPAGDVTAVALQQLLRNFLWKRIAIITSTRSTCWTFTQSMYFELTRREFIVENIIEVSDTLADDAISRQLNTIGADTKGKREI